MSLKSEALKAHNTVRAQEGKPPLLWCEECAEAAQAWADTLARTQQFTHGNLHTTHGQMGQNLAMGGKNFSVGKAVDSWIQEKGSYRADCPQGCGHYTQVVWRGTTHVGMGIAQTGNRRYIVANYHPPGNWAGQYRDNV